MWLGYSPRGPVAYKRNGPGGKLEKNEMPAHAAARESREECDVDVSFVDLNPVGMVTILWPYGCDALKTAEKLCVTLWLYTCPASPEQPFGCSEGFLDPQWYDATRLPVEQMAAFDRLTMQYLLGVGRASGQIGCVEGELTVAPDGSVLLDTLKLY